jgi:hypothetical protein
METGRPQVSWERSSLDEETGEPPSARSSFRRRRVPLFDATMRWSPPLLGHLPAGLYNPLTIGRGGPRSFSLSPDRVAKRRAREAARPHDEGLAAPRPELPRTSRCCSWPGVCSCAKSCSSCSSCHSSLSCRASSTSTSMKGSAHLPRAASAVHCRAITSRWWAIPPRRAAATGCSPRMPNATVPSRTLTSCTSRAAET